MRVATMVKLPDEWIVDYQAARDRAIEWLGDRYLLARDVTRRVEGGTHASDAHATRAGRRNGPGN
jgi:hypothetical protein